MYSSYTTSGAVPFFQLMSNSVFMIIFLDQGLMLMECSIMFAIINRYSLRVCLLCVDINTLVLIRVILVVKVELYEFIGLDLPLDLI